MSRLRLPGDRASKSRLLGQLGGSFISNCSEPAIGAPRGDGECPRPAPRTNRPQGPLFPDALLDICPALVGRPAPCFAPWRPSPVRGPPLPPAIHASMQCFHPLATAPAKGRPFGASFM